MFTVKIKGDNTPTTISDQKEWWFNRAKMARGSRNWSKAKVNEIVEAWERLGDEAIGLEFDAGHTEMVSIKVFLASYYGMSDEGGTPQETENPPATAEEGVPF
jgi:hypothetical protein|tara:strand:- start:433 stop:741 length:309 start_codon:yes stop_codon:yes gene_type:complete